MNSSQLTSLAVLPFANLSGDPEKDYLSDGITEEIISALSMIEGLKVIARSSSFALKNTQLNSQQVGRQLGVNSLLEGSVRQHGPKIRISVRLIGVVDGLSLWTQSYDRQMGDLFALQDEISLLIAEHIRSHYGHLELDQKLIKPPTDNLEAYNLYLKGRYHQLKWTPESIREGMACYQQSLAQDPQFALPYFSLGVCYGIMGSWGHIEKKEARSQAFLYLEAGFKREKNLPLGRVSRAGVHFWLNWDVRAALQDLYHLSRHQYSMAAVPEALAEIYTALGQVERAEQQARLAISLDPLSAPHHYTLAHVHYLQGKVEQAVNGLETTLSLNPQWQIARELKAACLIRMGKREDLTRYLEKTPQLNELSPLIVKLFDCFSQPHDSPPGQSEPSSPHSLEGRMPWQLYLEVHSQKPQQALLRLKQGVKERKALYLYFSHDPFLQPLHAFPEFQELVQQTFPPFDLQPVPLSPTPRAPFSQQEVATLLNQLQHLQQEQQAYLDPNLNLKGLAEQLGIHPNKLSWLINEGLGKNFNEYINGFRLKAFQEKALSPNFAHLSLLGIAYECGFNSKSTFNAYFKKETGLSPRAWLRQ